MKKIRCARCSVVNLEGFASFPNCAACGARLPEIEAEVLPFWRRPVGTAVWASVLGTAIVGVVLIAATWLQRDVETQSTLVVLTPPQLQVQAGEPFLLALRVDAVDIAERQSTAPLRNVRLRVVFKILQQFQILAVSPLPSGTSEVGRARYFTYNELPRGSQIELKLRALRLGTQKFHARIYSDKQTSDAVDVKVRVRPAPRTPFRPRQIN
ncbi:MAG TPA: hypothetical protein VF681_09050 [Abditibacteriaceae bacterium]|jgi:hypothetical protein